MAKYTKDHVRDYATEAFRFYAKVGGEKKYIDTLVEEMKRQEKQRDGIKDSGICKPTEAALMRKETVLRDRAAEIADLAAVEKTLHIVGSCVSGREVRLSMENVYFKDPWKDLEKGDIHDRVHYCEIHIPASERQIYRWLKKARLTFAEERGLRL